MLYRREEIYYLKRLDTKTVAKLILNTEKEEEDIPEKKLLIQILYFAIKDALGQPDLVGIPNHRRYRIRQNMINSAMIYIMSDNEEPFSCKWICDQLDLEHNDIKLAVKRN